MIKFSQFLNEIFNTPLPWTTVRSDSKESIFKFGKGLTYTATITTYPRIGDNKSHVVNFNHNGDYFLKHTGEDPFKVYSTIRDVVRNYDNEGRIKRGDVLMYSTFDNRTNSVYKNLTKRITQDINGTIEANGEKGTFMIKK